MLPVILRAQCEYAVIGFMLLRLDVSAMQPELKKLTLCSELCATVAVIALAAIVLSAILLMFRVATDESRRHLTSDGYVSKQVSVPFSKYSSYSFHSRSKWRSSKKNGRAA